MSAADELKMLLAEMERKAHWSVSVARLMEQHGGLSPGEAQSFSDDMAEVAARLRKCAAVASRHSVPRDVDTANAEAVGDSASVALWDAINTYALAWAAPASADPEPVVLWDAINAYVVACGGRTGSDNLSNARMVAVVAVEAALLASAKATLGHEPAGLQAAYDELAEEHGSLCEDIEEHLGAYSCDREGNEASPSEVVRFVGEDLRVLSRAILPGSTRADREAASDIAAEVLRGSVDGGAS